jgi:hypothetical protein
MIGILVFLLGALLVALVLYDFLRTAISFSGLGFISRRVAYGLWPLACRAAWLTEGRYGVSLRGAIGPLILSAIAFSWIFVHLVGYTLMYASGPSLADADTGVPATIVQTISFAGSALSTLGASVVQPTNGWWDALSMVAAVNGMIVLTLSVSFILGIQQITTTARSLATRYSALMSRDADRSEVEVLHRAASLGPDICRVAVQLTMTPLPGVFVPNDRTMNFPRLVLELCDLVERQGIATREDHMADADIAELRWGLGLLGRNYRSKGDRSDVEAARRWARQHMMPDDSQPASPSSST